MAERKRQVRSAHTRPRPAHPLSLNKAIHFIGHACAILGQRTLAQLRHKLSFQGRYFAATEGGKLRLTEKMSSPARGSATESPVTCPSALCLPLPQISSSQQKDALGVALRMEDKQRPYVYICWKSVPGAGTRALYKLFLYILTQPRGQQHCSHLTYTVSTHQSQLSAAETLKEPVVEWGIQSHGITSHPRDVLSLGLRNDRVSRPISRVSSSSRNGH